MRERSSKYISAHFSLKEESEGMFAEDTHTHTHRISLSFSHTENDEVRNFHKAEIGMVSETREKSKDTRVRQSVV